MGATEGRKQLVKRKCAIRKLVDRRQDMHSQLIIFQENSAKFVLFLSVYKMQVVVCNMGLELTFLSYIGFVNGHTLFWPTDKGTGK